MSTTLATANLNFGRSAGAHRRDVQTMREAGAVVIATQEDNRGKHRERVGVRMRTIRSGSVLASLSRHGYRIRLRRFAWADVDLRGLPMIRVVSVHMPPRRMPLLVPIYARRLRRLIRRTPHPVLAGGDWNRLLRNDPAGLVATFGGRWHGEGIDGWWVPPELVLDVSRVRCVDQRHRNDGHPFVYLTLTARRTRP